MFLSKKNLLRLDALLLILAILSSCDLTGLLGDPPGKKISPPTVSGTTPTNNKRPTWTWTIPEGTSVVSYKLNTGSWTTAQPDITSFTPPSDLADGKYIFYVKVQGESGGWSNASEFAITVDTVPPNPPAVSVAIVGSQARPQWGWTGSDDSAGFRYQLDSESPDGWITAGAGATAFSPTNDLSSAEHTLFVQAVDAAGNWSTSGSAVINLDPDAPLVTGTTPTSSPTPTWTWTIATTVTAFSYQLDGGGWTEVGADVRSYSPTSPLAEGSHTLAVTARMASGAWSAESSFTILIDLTPPALPVFDDNGASTTDRRPLWTWTGSEDTAQYRMQLDDDSGSGWMVTSSTTCQFQPAVDLPFGSHTLYLQAADGVGNWSASVTYAKSIVVLAPAVSGTVYSTSLTPSWTWTVPQGATGIEHQLDSTSGFWTSEDIVTTSYTYSGSPTLFQGNHTLYVRARCDGGCSSVSQWTTIIDTVSPDAPAVQGTTPSPEKMPLWRWAAPYDATSGIGAYRYQLDGEGGAWTEVPVTTTEYRLPFVMEEPHTLYVQAADRAGNWSASGSLCIDSLWHDQILDTNTSVVGQDISIAMSASGYPMICYPDASTSSLLLMQWDGSSWQKQVLDQGGAGSQMSFSVNIRGHKDISYMDPTGSSLKLIYQDVYNNIDVQKTVETNAARITRLRSVSDNVPRIRVVYAREGGIAKFLTNYSTGLKFSDPPAEVGSEWAITPTVDNAGVGYILSLAASGLCLRSWNGVSWSSAKTIASLAADANCSIAVVVDGPLSGAVSQRVAYSSSSNEVWYMRGTSSAWDSPQRIHVGSSLAVGTVAIAWDSLNRRPVIAYTIGSDLYCAILINGSWHEEQVDCGVSKCASVAVDPSGVVYMAYYDAATGRMEYAKRD